MSEYLDSVRHDLPEYAATPTSSSTLPALCRLRRRLETASEGSVQGAASHEPSIAWS